MIKLLPESEGKVLAFQASDTLTADDYETIFMGAVEGALRRYGAVRALVRLAPDFRGWDPAAPWEGDAFGARHRTDFEKMALVGAEDWKEWGVKLDAHLAEGEARTFAAEEERSAWVWLQD